MKKVLALTLALVLALSMSTMAFAANKNAKVNKAEDDWYTYDKLGSISKWADENELTAPDGSETMRPGDSNTQTIKLVGAAFGWDEHEGTGTPKATAGATLSKKQLDNVSVHYRNNKGASVIDEVTLNKDKSQVEIKFKDTLASTSAVEFKFQVYLKVGSKQSKAVTFTGKMENNETSQDSTDYYDFSDKSIMKPSEFIRSFEGYLGAGVSVKMRGLKNAKYWGFAVEEMKDSDQDLFIKYPALFTAYHLQTVGMTNVVDSVTLGDADAAAYVYDKDLNLLGRGNAKDLPLLDTYYLASAILDVDNEVEPEEEEPGEDYEPEDWGGNTSTGGDDLYPENPHDNPGTGK